MELDASDDRDRIALAIAERAGALRLAPGGGGRIHVELAAADLDHARAARLCRDATDRRWQAYRTIERYAQPGDVCRRRQLLDHFGDPAPGAPLGRCCDVHDPPDWLPEVRVTGGRRAKAAAAAAAEDGPPVSDDDLAPLKAWRRERAEGKPAYTVATDATLREIVRRRPSTEAELLEIKGIGRSFVAKHAESLLDLLSAGVGRPA